MKTVTNKQIICTALGMNELQYAEMVEEFGQLWMNRYFGHEEIMLNALNKSKTFWAWWVNQWENRNEDYVRLTNLAIIELPLDRVTKAVAIELYRETHAANELKIVPNKFVVAEVNKLIKQEELNLKNIINVNH